MKPRWIQTLCGFSLILLVFLACTCASQQSQHVPNQISKRVWTKLGYNLEMSCVSMPNRTIQYCGWDRNSEKETNLSLSINFNATATTKPVPGYTVNQAALLDGECKIKIQRVSLADVTLWNCTVMTSGHKTPYLGSVDVVLSKKPTSPEILNKECLKNLLDGENISGNSTVNVTCCTKGGVPSPELTLMFDNEAVMTSGDEIGSHDCLYWPMVKFNWTDNESRVKCKAAHNEYLDTDITEDFIDLNIFYAPKITNNLELANLPNDSTIIHFIKSNLTKIKIINVTHSANPEAIVDWIFQPNISNVVNFTEELQQLSKWRWVSTLSLNVSNITEGSAINFQFHLRNEFGLRVLKFELIRSSGHTSPSNLPSWMWLFIVIIAAIIFQVLIVCGVYMCRRNFCLFCSGRAGRLSVSTSAPTRRRKWAESGVDTKSGQIDQRPPPEISAPLMELNKFVRPGEEGWVTPTNYDWRYPADSLQAESESDSEPIFFRQESVQIQFHATSNGFECEPKGVDSTHPKMPSRGLTRSNNK